MRFGCCLNMVSTNPDGTGVENIEMIAELGYDYAELPLAEIVALEEEEFYTLLSRVKSSGIRCEVCNNFFPGTIRLTGENVDNNQVIEYVKKALSRANSLGVEYVVFGSGKAKNVPDNFPLERGYKQVVQLLKQIGPIAKEKDITIVIEPLRKAECNIINTFAEGCKLAEDTADSNVKVLVDFYHLTVEQEPVENLLLQGDKYLRHVHFANSNGRIYPVSINEDDYKPFIDALKKIGYTERVSCEAYAADFCNEAAKTIKFFKENFY